MSEVSDLLRAALEARLDQGAFDAVQAACEEAAGGVDSTRFGVLLSGLSRSVRPRPLEPSPASVERMGELVEDFDPERWNTLEAARVLLITALPDQGGSGFAQILEDAFTYADEGELCALLKALPLVEGPERFLWRAGEGCRSNMRSVFESAACDSPYAAQHFDDVAFKQAVLKALFVGAPLWRIRGLDGRLSEDLARMALDYVDERRSAGRPVPRELWLCLGPFGGSRAEQSLERELEGAGPLQRAAVGIALGRAGHSARLEELIGAEHDAETAELMRAAAAGQHSQGTFAELERRAQQSATAS